MSKRRFMLKTKIHAQNCRSSDFTEGLKNVVYIYAFITHYRLQKLLFIDNLKVGKCLVRLDAIAALYVAMSVQFMVLLVKTSLDYQVFYISGNHRSIPVEFHLHTATDL